MAAITLAQAQAQFDAWLAASLAVAGNQSYAIAGRSLTRVDAAEISRQLAYWERRVVELQNAQSGARRRTRYVVT